MVTGLEKVTNFTLRVLAIDIVHHKKTGALPKDSVVYNYLGPFKHDLQAFEQALMSEVLVRYSTQ